MRLSLPLAPPLFPGICVAFATALSSALVSCRDDGKKNADPPSPYGVIREYNQPESFVHVATAGPAFVAHERLTSDKRTPPLLRELKERGIPYFTYGNEQAALFVEPDRAEEVIGLGIDPGGFAARFLDSPGLSYRDYLARRMFFRE